MSGGQSKEKIENLTEEEEDLYETLIEKSGCAQYHYALQDCYFEYNDWRKCTKEMQDKCVNEQKKQKK